MRQTTEAKAWEGPFTNLRRIVISDINFTVSKDDGLKEMATWPPGLGDFINFRKPHVEPPEGFEQEAPDVVRGAVKIPIRHYDGPFAPPEPVTVQIGYYEDGEFVMEECNHAGAEEEDMEFAAMSWWADAHTYVPDDSVTETHLVCDKCGAWQDYDDKWNND